MIARPQQTENAEKIKKSEAVQEVSNELAGSSEKPASRLAMIVDRMGRQRASLITNKSDQQIRRYTQGAEPPFKVVQILAQEANVSIDWLAGRTEEPESHTIRNDHSPSDKSDNMDVASSQIDEDCLRDVIAAVEIELKNRNKELPPDRKALLIKEIYTHAREERQTGTRDDKAREALKMFIRRMVNVAS